MPFSPGLEVYGADSQLFILNNGPMLVGIVVLLLINLATYTLNRIAQKCYKKRCCRKIGVSIHNNIAVRYPLLATFINDFLGLGFASYMNFLFLMRNTDEIGEDLFSSP